MTLQEATQTIDMFYGPPLSVISDCLRGFIVAKPGHRLLAADFSAIEARVLAWLAGERWVLEVFKTHGKIYEAAAANIYNVDYIENVTKEQRQIGKVAELALGYGGGVKAFQSMAKNFGLKVSDEAADKIKFSWRASHPYIVEYWSLLEKNARYAVRDKGFKYHVNNVTYLMKGSFLWCQLPSKRVLCYPYPKIEMVETPWGEMREGLTYMSEDSISRKWSKQKAYGGLLCENVTQAVARDVLADAMVRVEKAGFPIVMHVHDEIVAEIPWKEGFASRLKDFETLMAQVPAWAEGLPIACEGWEGKRFRK